MPLKVVTKEATLDTKELREAIQQVAYLAVNKRLPVLSNIKTEFINGKAILTTNDLERIVRVEIDSTNNDDFSVLLPRNATEKFLTGANGKVSVTSIGDKSVGLSREDIGRLNLTTFLVSDYPSTPLIPDNLEWHSIDSRWLCRMLRIVSTACATEETRPILTGINFRDGAIAAADGFRLVVLKDDRLSFGLGDKEANVPLKTIALITKLFGRAETVEIAFSSKTENTPSGIEETPQYIYARAGGVLVISSLIQVAFLQYQNLIPNRFECKATFSAPLLSQRLSMIERDALPSDIVRFSFKITKQNEQVCSISAKMDEGEGDYHFPCPVKFEGKEAKIAFNHEYITEAIKPFSVCSLELTSTSSPGKITGDIDGLTIVVMPMFVQWE